MLVRELEWILVGWIDIFDKSNIQYLSRYTKTDMKILQHIRLHTAQKMGFSSKDFFCKCDQISSFLQIWSHLLKKSLIENFIFCAVSYKNSIKQISYHGTPTPFEVYTI